MLARRGAQGRKVRSLPASRVAEPWVSAHRGFGELFAPDSSPSAQLAALAQPDRTNLFLDVDTNSLIDDEAVIHDSTVNRTTNGTGNVSSYDKAGFKALLLDPASWADPMPGWPNETPQVFSEWLEVTRRGKMPFLCEAKDSTAAAALITQLASVKKSVLLAVHTLPLIATVKAAGFACMYLPASSGETAASIVAAAPEYVAIGIGWYDDTWRATLAAAGIKIASATSARRSVFASEVARPGTVGMASSDPAYTLRKIAAANTDNFASGVFGHGLIPSASNSAVSGGDIGATIRPNFTGTPKRLYFQDPSTTKAQWALIGPMCRDAPFTSITFTITFDANSSTATSWPGVSLWCPDDRDYYSGQSSATNLGQGIVCFLRQNGSMEMYRQDTPGVVSTSIATPVASAAVAAGAAVPCKAERIIGGADDEKIKFTRLDTGAFVMTTAAQGVGGPGGWNRGGYFHFGKSLASDGISRRSFSTVTVTP